MPCQCTVVGFRQIVAHVDHDLLAPRRAQRRAKVVAVEPPGRHRSVAEVVTALRGPQIEDPPTGPVQPGRRQRWDRQWVHEVDLAGGGYGRPTQLPTDQGTATGTHQHHCDQTEHEHAAHRTHRDQPLRDAKKALYM